jgi:pectin methylesterase-like acyl-CoA thioesterase
MQNTATTAKLRVRILRKLVVGQWGFPAPCLLHAQPRFIINSAGTSHAFASIQLNVAATPEERSNARGKTSKMIY